MKPIIIFTGATGLNTVMDPVRIPAQKSGLSDLQVAVNVTIDQSFRTSRRAGVVKLQDGGFHSLFCDGGDCFVVSGTTMYLMAPDGSIMPIREGLTEGARVSFAQAGSAVTYYTNGCEMGRVEDGIDGVWGAGVYNGPDTTRLFVGPVPGQHIASFYGRMLIAQGPVLWWSELYDYGLYNPAGSFVQFSTKIRMIKSVAGGCFISTERSTYFLSGANPEAWHLIKVASFSAVEWSDAIEYVEGGDIGMDPGLCALWASHEGAILGTPGGQIKNLTKDRVIYPGKVKIGFGCLVGYSFIHGMC